MHYLEVLEKRQKKNVFQKKLHKGTSVSIKIFVILFLLNTEKVVILGETIQSLAMKNIFVMRIQNKENHLNLRQIKHLHLSRIS